MNDICERTKNFWAKRTLDLLKDAEAPQLAPELAEHALACETCRRYGKVAKVFMGELASSPELRQETVRRLNG